MSSRTEESIIRLTGGNAIEQMKALIAKPPLCSRVMHIEPRAAEAILATHNKKNRPTSDRSAHKIKNQIVAEDYELTGDTLKFTKAGRLIDGQHRLKGCILAETPILTHVVFGLSDDVFDVIDQGKKRTAGDVLHLYGVKDYTVVASAIGWAVKMEKGFKNHDTHLTVRQIRKLATGPMKGMANWVNEARLISKAFREIPPSQVLAMLFLISKKDNGLARDFAHEWVYGARIGRNKTFDQLSMRLINLRKQGAGEISGTMRMALMIVAFNYWNADEVATPRAMTWRKEWRMPTLEFDGETFKKRHDDAMRSDTRLIAEQLRVMDAMKKSAKNDVSSIAQPDLAKQANVDPRHMPSVMKALMQSKLLFIAKKEKGQITSYRIPPKALDTLREMAS